MKKEAPPQCYFYPLIKLGQTLVPELPCTVNSYLPLLSLYNMSNNTLLSSTNVQRVKVMTRLSLY